VDRGCGRDREAAVITKQFVGMGIAVLVVVLCANLCAMFQELRRDWKRRLHVDDISEDR
jgi:hypothetical protein